ncbi:MAG TPA: oxygenase MpaB family protein [Mycobacterium sp.]|nr:oxygenase MpaB family protein [Mycobacterium sp.]
MNVVHLGANMVALTAEQAHELVLGPESLSWRYASDPRTVLGGAFVQLMHLTHPTVGAGVRDHSSYRADPFGRLNRTLDYINLVTYGGPDAVEVAQRVREMHRTIKGVNPDGTRYHAFEPEAFAWVQATLVNGLVMAADQLIGAAMTDVEREQLYREQLGLGLLLGVRRGDLPETWSEFETYRDDMIEKRLTFTDTAREYLDVVRRPNPPKALSGLTSVLWPALRIPSGYASMLITVGMLPAVIRERLDLTWSQSKQAQFDALTATLRGVTPILPTRVRVSGPSRLRKRADQIIGHPFAPQAKS